MATHIIVDGYNLIRRSPTLSRLDRRDLALGREALISGLAAYRKIKPHRITVVFDGVDAPADSPARDVQRGVHVLFSRCGETADAVIVRLAGQEREKALVVTSDGAVARAAQACGAAAIDSPEFEFYLMQAAVKEAVPFEEEPAARRVDTRKKGAGHRLPKRVRKNLNKASKL
ncbi:MAG: NYN domain-containing protein [Desulfobacterales bacterium]